MAGKTKSLSHPIQHTRVKRARPQVTQPLRRSARLENQRLDKLASTASCRVEDPHGSINSVHEEAAQKGGDSESELSQKALQHWVERGQWPKEYFEEVSPNMKRQMQLRGQAKSRGTKTSSQTPQESSMLDSETLPPAKGIPHKNQNFPQLLAEKAIQLRKGKEGVRPECRIACKELFQTHQTVPEHSRFSENVFEKTCARLQDRNEAKIIQDISRLIVPSVEELADFGASHLEHLVESVNKLWDHFVPLMPTSAKPDYAVGFGKDAFTPDQHSRMRPFVNSHPPNQSFFTATPYMYFPFLTCEVKSPFETLDIADRQNAVSMALAVRAVVELFRKVKREHELHRVILAFSISHDHQNVRIYGHYAEIDKSESKYYYHPIYSFDFTTLEGREKWTTYKFTKNVYETWMPTHLKRICSAIDQIPAGISFAVSRSELDFQDSPRLPQSNVSSDKAQSNMEEE